MASRNLCDGVLSPSDCVRLVIKDYRSEDDMSTWVVSES